MLAHIWYKLDKRLIIEAERWKWCLICWFVSSSICYTLYDKKNFLWNECKVITDSFTWLIINVLLLGKKKVMFIKGLIGYKLPWRGISMGLQHFFTWLILWRCLIFNFLFPHRGIFLVVVYTWKNFFDIEVGNNSCTWEIHNNDQLCLPFSGKLMNSRTIVRRGVGWARWGGNLMQPAGIGYFLICSTWFVWSLNFLFLSWNMSGRLRKEGCWCQQ